jgi:hypothetical protein
MPCKDLEKAQFSRAGFTSTRSILTAPCGVLIFLAQNARGSLCRVRTSKGTVLEMRAQCEEDTGFGDGIAATCRLFPASF